MLLIRHAHAEILHEGPQLTRSYIARSFWIVRGRVLVRIVINACTRRARYAAKPMQQLMEALPSARVTHARPFSRLGVDFALLMCEYLRVEATSHTKDTSQFLFAL